MHRFLKTTCTFEQSLYSETAHSSDLPYSTKYSSALLHSPCEYKVILAKISVIPFIGCEICGQLI